MTSPVGLLNFLRVERAGEVLEVHINDSISIDRNKFILMSPKILNTYICICLINTCMMSFFVTYSILSVLTTLSTQATYCSEHNYSE